MPVSSQSSLADVLKNAPTRYDLYSLEETIGRALDGIADARTPGGKTDVADLADQLDEVRKSVDGLAMAIEKLPEQLAGLLTPVLDLLSTMKEARDAGVATAKTSPRR